MSGAGRQRRRRLHLLDVIAASLDALAAADDDEPAEAVEHLRRAERLAANLADLIDARPEVTAR
ncbi:MAG: hypothetical protein M3P96_04075 [Actinomycetota bacterium]|nr:hypothetical protein [Actinomycetota bacterium]